MNMQAPSRPAPVPSVRPGMVGRARLPRAIPAVIAAAWLLAVFAQAGGRAEALHHDGLAHAGLPLWLVVALFIVSWQAMTAAMMLPSTIPMLRLFAVASATQDRRRVAFGAFIGGYALVWSLFGLGAFAFDLGLHRLLEHRPWLVDRPHILTGAVLIVAGVFQFSTLKDRCLDTCRHPGAYLLPRYRRGVANAYRLGWSHGLFCLGCCWALMLVMFTVGMANLSWMAVLTALMVYEKVGRAGRTLGDFAGGALIALGTAVLFVPRSVPLL